MRRRVVLALLLASLTSPAFGQEWARKMFETTSHDFGGVARGSKVEYAFKFKNIYKEDVHVLSVRSSCGCTTAEVTRDTLKTYETSEIVAHFNTRSFLGSKSATITVTIDKPFYAEVQLQVGGYIRSDVVLSPAAIELGTVDQGQSREKRLEVRYAGRDDWRIDEIQAPNPYLETSLVELSRGGGQVSYELNVRLKDDAPVGYIKDQIYLVTNDHRTTRVPVDVEGRVESAITISPASLFLGVLQPGQEVTKKLVVRGKKPFRILHIECDDDCFRFTPSGEAKPLHLLPVTFTAGSKTGKLTCKIRITTDLDGGTVEELLAHAQIMPAVESSAAR